MPAKSNKRFARIILAVTSCLCFLPLEAQQSSSPAPQAPPFFSRAIATMTGGTRIKSAALSGTITLYSPTKTATSTFIASANDSGQSEFSVSNGLSESRSQSAGIPSGSVVGPDGASYALTTLNAMATSAWFVPTVMSRLLARDYANSYVGNEMQNGVQVVHLQVWQQASGMTPDAAAAIKSATLEDVYLDQGSHLPVVVAFNLHLNSGSLSNVPVQVFFSNYKSVERSRVPYQIQVYMSGSLFWDLQVSSASFTH